MGTRPQCLVNLLFFSLGDVGESAPSASGWTLTRIFTQSPPATTTPKSGGRQSTRRPEYALLDANAVGPHRLVHGLRFRGVDERPFTVGRRHVA